MGNNKLPRFPTDDLTLNHLEHAMLGYYTVDSDGTHHLVGADFTVSQFLEFLSGYDENKAVFDKYIGAVPCFIYPDQIYSEYDVLEALIAEIRWLRGLLNGA